MAFGKSTSGPRDFPRANNIHVSRKAPRPPAVPPSLVLEKTDIISLIGEVVDLRPRAKKSEMIGLCPFHGDSHPSFEVNGDKQIYSCWSCSAGLNGSRGGDAITFVRRYYNMGFREAVHYLARREGIPIPESNNGKPEPVARPAFVPRKPVEPTGPVEGAPNLGAEKAPILSALQKAQEIFSSQLNTSQSAKDYLFIERGIDPALLGRYVIGYAPDDFGTLRKHFPEYDSSDLLIDAGLARLSIKKTKFDFFRDRLMFGVRNAEGQLVAFGGRRLSDAERKNSKGEVIRTPKYLNSPETAVFSKRDVIFGWYEAQEAVKQEGFALIVEGYMDVLGLASKGVNNASACMGTALTESHITTMLGATKSLVFCMDGDKAGQEGAFRSLSGLFPHLDPDVSVAFMTLPDNMDPDEYVRKHGKPSFMKQVKQGQDLPAFWEKALTTLYPADMPDYREKLWRNANDLIDLLPENNPQRSQLRQIAARLAGKSQQKQTSAPMARKGLSTFLVNEPSDRLFLAVMKLPQVAASVRPTLIGMQSNADPSLLPALASWQTRYDQAMAAGMATNCADALLPAEVRQFTAIIEASGSILSQFLAAIERKQMDEALRTGNLDETAYLSKMQRSGLAKPN